MEEILDVIIFLIKVGVMGTIIVICMIVLCIEVLELVPTLIDKINAIKEKIHDEID